MGVITLLTDFGTTDYYVAAMKARLHSLRPDVPVFDISHGVAKYKIDHGAFMLKAVFREFPEGSIHIIGIGSASDKSHHVVAASIENHIFICRDNGFLSLISSQMPDWVLDLGEGHTTFPELDVMVPAVPLLLEKGKDAFATTLPGLNIVFTSETQYNNAMVMGSVLYSDDYGNFVVDIEKSKFEERRQDRRFSLKVGRHQFKEISENYNDTESGEVVVVFNHLGYLEIAINQGNAKELLGVSEGSPIIIRFDQ